MQETGEGSKPRQLSFEHEIVNRAHGEALQENQAREAAEQARIGAIRLPSAEELAASMQGRGNLRQRVMDIATGASAQGKSATEVGDWARQVSNELGLNGKKTGP